MNFKNIFSFSLLILSLVLSSCGVKSNPIAPAGTQIPSYLDQFLDIKQADKEVKSLKKSK